MYRKCWKIKFFDNKMHFYDLNPLLNAFDQLSVLEYTLPDYLRPISIFLTAHRSLTGAVSGPNFAEKWDF